MSEAIKRKTIEHIANDKVFNYIGKAKYQIGNTVVHVRFCNTDLRGSSKYKFNINPHTLSADYEIWICGRPDSYYLIPISIMNDIYSHPDAYIDTRHPEIRVVTLDAGTNRLIYARGGVSLNLGPYRGIVLK